jgi:hypothetical protein
MKALLKILLLSFVLITHVACDESSVYESSESRKMEEDRKQLERDIDSFSSPKYVDKIMKFLAEYPYVTIQDNKYFYFSKVLVHTPDDPNSYSMVYFFYNDSSTMDKRLAATHDGKALAKKITNSDQCKIANTILTSERPPKFPVLVATFYNDDGKFNIENKIKPYRAEATFRKRKETANFKTIVTAEFTSHDALTLPLDAPKNWELMFSITEESLKGFGLDTFKDCTNSVQSSTQN